MSRRLAAIMAADIVGYSALMSEDETGTLEALRRMRAEVFNPAVAGHRGKTVKNMGDGWLVEFASSADAVACALQIQKGLAQNSRLALRCGIHIGDVTFQDEDIFGDGVNIAARLEALSNPGAITISDAVYGSLDGTLTPAFESAGEKMLKNIPRPMHVWIRHAVGKRIASYKSSFVRDQRAGFPVIVAINPFTTRDPRPEVNDLAAALTSDLSNYLSNGRWLRSTIEETAVAGAYVLSGSLRAIGDRLRLDTALSDPSRHQIWSRRVDGNLSESFDWQDDTGLQIAEGVVSAIYESEKKRVNSVQDQDETAASALLKAMLSSVTRPNEAEVLYSAVKRSIELDSTWALPYAWACFNVTFTPKSGYGANLRQYTDMFGEWHETGSELAVGDPLAQLLLEYSASRKSSSANRVMLMVNELLRQHPFHNTALMIGAMVCNQDGDPDSAISFADKLIEFSGDPQMRTTARVNLAVAFIQLGNDKDAVAFAEPAVAHRPGAPVYLAALASAYALAGRIEEARTVVEKLLRIAPGMTVRGSKRHFYKDAPGILRYLDGLRRARLPEGDK